jgi:hypothetical protein
MRDLCERWNIDFDTFHPEVPKDILLIVAACNHPSPGSQSSQISAHARALGQF